MSATEEHDGEQPEQGEAGDALAQMEIEGGEAEQTEEREPIGTGSYDPEDNKLRLRAFARLPPDIYARVKAAGFSWAPRQQLFVAPKWTPEREDLLLELCGGEIGDEDTSLVQRAEERAERFEGYEERRTTEALRAKEAVARIADNIPLGQPILVGHHSERHARRDAERIRSGMRKAVNLWRTAQYWSSRAEAVAPPEEMLACVNGLLHIPTRKMFPHTPEFRNTFAVDYDYNERALPSNLWINFLNQLWPDDQQSIETLQEMFGLLLTNDTSFQKAFMIIGPPRSGKGTLIRVLQRLLGKEHIAATTLSALGETFGKQPLLNKTVAIMSDVRIDGRSDLQAVSETLLSITGEDTVPVNRKNQTTLMEQLRVRFLLTTNTVPRLPDSSEALTKRFIMLQLMNSFYGNEDRGLTEKLTDERGMPGLLNWALDGLRRLHARGYFIQPESAETSTAMFREASNPVGEFVKEYCEVGDDRESSCKDLYTVWGAWCDDEGIRNKSTSQTLGVALHAMLPRVNTKRKGGRADRYKSYNGISLNAAGKAKLQEVRDHANNRNSNVIPFMPREF